jgi:hypothetical protein
VARQEESVTALEHIFAAQYYQQRLIHGELPEGRPEQVELAKTFALQLQDELVSYMRATGYKMLAGAELPRETRIIELVDVFKYLLAIAWTEGISAHEFADAFMGKTKTVADRLRISAESSKICAFDIDGVLAEYQEWHDGIDATMLRPLPGARALLERLKTEGWTILIVTSRKIWVNQKLERDTHDWLQGHGFPYDRILWGYDKLENLKSYGAKLQFFVDDQEKHCIDVESGGIKTWRITKDKIGHRDCRNVGELEAELERAGFLKRRLF